MLTLLEKGRARARMPRTLILEPTRELAAQVEENFKKLRHATTSSPSRCSSAASPSTTRSKKLDRGVDVLIATPGRLLDQFERGKLLLTGVEILVIDEADRMLDMGFIPDIERICKLLPFTRQTLFFSATMPPEIQRLADSFLSQSGTDRGSRAGDRGDDHRRRSWSASGRKPDDKRAALRALHPRRDRPHQRDHLLQPQARRRDARPLARSGTASTAGALHGDMDQRSRTETLDDFRKDKLTLLVASDVAARGLDIPAVSHVFNFDVPIHAEDYVHRIGRTGRAGRSGTAITIATPLDRKYVAAIEKLIGQPIKPMAVEADGERAAPFYGHRHEKKDAGDSEAARVTRPERSERRGRGRAESPRRPHRGQRNNSERTVAAAPSLPARGAAKDRLASPSRPRQPGTRRRPDAPPAENPRPRRGPCARRPPAETSRPRDAPPRGLGDHVPQFLLRRTRVPSVQ